MKNAMVVVLMVLMVLMVLLSVGCAASHERPEPWVLDCNTEIEGQFYVQIFLGDRPFETIEVYPDLRLAAYSDTLIIGPCVEHSQVEVILTYADEP